MSAYNQNENKTLETVKSSGVRYESKTSSATSEDLSAPISSLSALEALSLKIDMCLKKQRQVNFISREIADIVKKSS